MRGLVILGLLAATAAHADPSAFDVTEADVASLMNEPVRLEEPVGLEISADQPRLGLRKGDIVYAIDGQTPIPSPFADETRRPVLYLDVLRGGSLVELRLVVALAPDQVHVERQTLQTFLDLSQSMRPFDQVTAHGKPSGVLVRSPLVPDVDVGDVIRSIDRRPTRTPDDALAAIRAAVGHDQMLVELARAGRPVTVTLVIDDPDQLPDDVARLVAQIRTTDHRHYVIPYGVIDKLLSNPMVFARSVRVVPTMRDGKPDGFKLYAIRPGSFPAALGLANGDTLLAINGNDLSSADKALEAYTKLRGATSLDVRIERHGKTLTLSYKIE